jgi:hypothetical protein
MSAITSVPTVMPIKALIKNAIGKKIKSHGFNSRAEVTKA